MKELEALEPLRVEIRGWLRDDLPRDWQSRMLGAPENDHVAFETGYWMQNYLYSWAQTISGGSSEAQRNIVAERGLGMPREPWLATVGG